MRKIYRGELIDDYFQERLVNLAFSYPQPEETPLSPGAIVADDRGTSNEEGATPILRKNIDYSEY